MGDNAPQGDGGERNEGLEIKSRPRESQSESRGSASHRGRHNSKTNHAQEEKKTSSVIFPVLWLLFRGVFIKLRRAVGLIAHPRHETLLLGCRQGCNSVP